MSPPKYETVGSATPRRRSSAASLFKSRPQSTLESERIAEPFSGPPARGLKYESSCGWISAVSAAEIAGRAIQKITAARAASAARRAFQAFANSAAAKSARNG